MEPTLIFLIITSIIVVFWMISAAMDDHSEDTYSRPLSVVESKGISERDSKMLERELESAKRDREFAEREREREEYKRHWARVELFYEENKDQLSSAKLSDSEIKSVLDSFISENTLDEVINLCKRFGITIGSFINTTVVYKPELEQTLIQLKSYIKLVVNNIVSDLNLDPYIAIEWSRNLRLDSLLGASRSNIRVIHYFRFEGYSHAKTFVNTFVEHKVGCLSHEYSFSLIWLPCREMGFLLFIFASPIKLVGYKPNVDVQKGSRENMILTTIEIIPYKKIVYERIIPRGMRRVYKQRLYT